MQKSTPRHSINDVSTANRHRSASSTPVAFTALIANDRQVLLANAVAAVVKKWGHRFIALAPQVALKEIGLRMGLDAEQRQEQRDELLNAHQREVRAITGRSEVSTIGALRK
jgi:hypothetical protein